MAYTYPQGLNETTGDILVTCNHLIGSGQIWYVSSVSGTDGSSPQGLDKSSPLATIGQAYTNASAGDIIMLMSDHEETLTIALTIAKTDLTIVGAGQASGKPTVKFTNNSPANANLFAVTAAGVSIRNIWFNENAQAINVALINVTGAGFNMAGCYFECGADNDAEALLLGSGANYARIETTTFISVATDSNKPSAAIRVTGGDILRPMFKQVVLDNGTYGWSNGDGNAALRANYDMTGARFEEISMLRGADADITGSSGTTTYYFNAETITGGGRIKVD